MVDEWGTWYDPEPNTNLGALYQQSTIRDALVAGINLNIFHKHADRVQMANIAQTVNVLQAVILTEKEKMLLTPTYHVFEMYKVHQGATLIPVELTAPEYKLGQATVPSLHASASRDKAGKLHLSIVSLDPNRPAEVSMKIVGASGKRNAQVGKGGLPPRAFHQSWAGENRPSQPANLRMFSITGRVLTAPAMNTVNTFDKPDVVKPAPFTDVKVQGDVITLTLPSKSVVVLEIQ
ncbi:MAG: hypothetical protein ND866_26570 [Pyrinomonadaceae bacterium]|nr:hypothetical protein [Pyrinomonadaceae bacterium]